MKRSGSHCLFLFISFVDQRHTYRRMDMKKSIILSLFILLSAMIVLSIVNQSGNSSTQNTNDSYPYIDHSTIIIDGQSISFDGVFFYYLGKEECVHVPFIRFLETIGYQFTQVDEDIFAVCINNRDYLFSKRTGELLETGNNTNVFVPYNGRDGYNIDVEEQDSYLEVKTIIETLDSLGVNMNVYVSCENKTIIIETGQEH